MNEVPSMPSNEILDKFSVPPEIRSRILSALTYDYSFLTNEFNDNQIRAGRPYSVEQVYPILARFGKADYEIARMLEEEFKRFVVLTLINPGVPHAPPGAVDMFWHFFVLHTEQYLQFSENIWGNYKGDPGYRHHYPAKEPTRPGQFRAYLATRALYFEVYGEPPVYRRIGALDVPVWNDPYSDADAEKKVTSGDSYSGIVEPETTNTEQSR